ncbi:MAG: hypothetical protein JWN60_1460 [Acidobacteria bacterium]|jgi:hypothetical protein|nr:hypothetical protein [Acidobacteriota bacterium]
MRKEKAKNPDDSANARNRKTAAKKSGTANAGFANELREPRWSVVSFENRVAKNLSYEQAERKIAELENLKISGLCIITDEAAERISN